MSLREYKRKRDFKITAEPAGKETKSETGRLFVVQKHDATRLHYDFRLEMGGVLKSWAVPRGFPSERGERRLAVHVEDHPLDYAKFEGIIPEGQYGGGTVMVWDFGSYAVEGDGEKALAAGKLKVVLSGEKLKGEWTLVHAAREEDERNWFLIKTGDSVKPVTKKAEEHSALSGRTLAQIAAQKDAVWDSNHGLAAEKRAEARGEESPQPAVVPGTAKKSAKTEGKKKAKRGVKRAEWIDPMKAILLEYPPTGPGWMYELKWDGYRVLALKNGDEVELLSRNKKPLSADFPEVVAAVKQLPVETAVLDGEVCALDEQGRPRFQLLQGREMGKQRPAMYYYVFDLLQQEDEVLLEQPLMKRKQALEKLLTDAPQAIRYSAPIEGRLEDLLEAVREQGMEGLIGKAIDSPYRPGQRTREWVKLKVSHEQEFVIGGFTPPKGARKHLGALLLGYFEKGELHFAGKVGTGFNEAWLKRLSALFAKLRGEANPFVDLQKYGNPRWGQGMTASEIRQCKWLKPELIAQVKFAEWTDDGLLRHAVFLGLREDKDASEVGRAG